MSRNTEAKALAEEGRRQLREAQERASEPVEASLDESRALAASGVPEGLRPWATLGIAFRTKDGWLRLVDLLVCGFGPVSRLMRKPFGGEWYPDSSWVAKGSYVPTLAMAMALAEEGA